MKQDEVAKAIRDTFISPNVPDSNLEPANVVDVIAGAGLNISRRHAEGMEGLRKTIFESAHKHGGCVIHGAERINAGMESIANAINNLAEAIREHE